MAEFFRLGGPLMWPLSICSVALLAVIAERAAAACGRRWREDQAERERHRRILLFFVEVAPALGLLGTMQGIIECFSLMGGANAGREALQGLGVAAITTVYGLVIALVATIASYALDAVGRLKAVQP